jgi:hypothetical protein
LTQAPTHSKESPPLSSSYSFSTQHQVSSQSFTNTTPSQSFPVFCSSPENVIGTIIEKPFNGKMYKGEVIEFDVLDDGRTIYKVDYEDGDKEDLELHEMIPYFPRSHDPEDTDRRLCMWELFAGSGVVSAEFMRRDWKTISVDNHPGSNATIKRNILEVDPWDLAHVADAMWISLPCETYSNLAGGRHRDSETHSKTSKALNHNLLFMKMVELISYARSRNPHLIVVIENPVGQLRKMPLMQELVEHMDLKPVLVDYCTLGRDEKKPTYLWTNHHPLCHYLSKYKCKYACRKNKQHEGVKGNVHNIDYSVIPTKLAREVARFIDAEMTRREICRKPAAAR